MKARLFALLSLTVALALLMPAGLRPSSAQPQASAPTSASARLEHAGLGASAHGRPLMFVENTGQFDARARFQVQGRSGALWLADDALWFTVLKPDGEPSTGQRGSSDLPLSPALRRSSVGVNLKLSFVGANPQPRLVPFSRLATHVSYFVGKDPAKWHADVPAWGGVRYVDLYPGVDLELSGVEGQWQPRLVAGSGADLSAVRLRVEGADGLELEGDSLRLTTAAGTIHLPLLRAVTAEGYPVGGSAVGPQVAGDEITAPFAAGQSSAGASQDTANFLIFSTFLGGHNYDAGWGMTVDAAGAIYVTGYTKSGDFPTTPGAFQTTFAGGNFDAFVTKLDASGTSLVYSTFIGGGDADAAYGGMGVDASGNALVAGRTSSSDFPTTAGAFQTTYAGGTCGVPPNVYPCDDVFVTKLNPTGDALIYSTYLGGTQDDQGWGLGVDAGGSAYVAGLTSSSDFPTTSGAFQATYGGGPFDAFVTKLAVDGSALVYSTFLGGPGSDYSTALVVDASGEAYVTGSTFSALYPTTTGAFQETCASCPVYADAFVTKLNATGDGLVYSTFVGGGSNECYLTSVGAFGCAITLDASGSAYITGLTESADFPSTAGAFQTIYGGGTCGVPPTTYACPDAFVTKLNAAGSALDYSTFLGGDNYDVGLSVAVDASDAAYVSGYTFSSNFPTTLGAAQTTCGGCATYSDGFAAKLNAAGSALSYSTYLGGSDNDGAYSIRVDANGVSYLAGFTSSSDFPVTSGAFQAAYGGGNSDAFVARLILATYWLYLPVVVSNP